jgi:hypothetical protein
VLVYHGAAKLGSPLPGEGGASAQRDNEGHYDAELQHVLINPRYVVATVRAHLWKPRISALPPAGWSCRSNDLADFEDSNIPERVRYFVVIWKV